MLNNSDNITREKGEIQRSKRIVFENDTYS